MMIRLLRQQRHPRHERERLAEIGEQEGSRDRIARIVMVPVGQPVERIDPLGFGQGFDHRSFLGWYRRIRDDRVVRMEKAITGLAPTADAIEALARAALAALPPEFRAHLGDIALRVEEFAEQDVLEQLGIEDPFDLTGLYTGRPVGEKSVADSGTLPDMIHLYRRPLLDEWVETGVRLDALVTHVLVHEVGHHFGLSDADMRALEDAAG